MNAVVDIKKGLEGVVVDSTSISLVDGEAGRLYYRGLPIEKLVHYPFAAVAHLVVFGDLPDAARLEKFEDFLWSAGRLPAELAGCIEKLAQLQGHPMATLQAAMPLLAFSPPAKVFGRTDDEQEALVAAARLPTALALLLARRAGQTPAVSRDSPLWRTFPATGAWPTAFGTADPRIRANPDSADRSQFQRQHLYGARGDLDFGAPGIGIGGGDGVTLWSAARRRRSGRARNGARSGRPPNEPRTSWPNALSAGRLVMGMGHREYRVVDPRSRIVKTLAEQIASTPDEKRLIETLKAVDEAFVAQTAQKKRSLRANLEFYKGVVYLALGLPKDFFTATFAAARIFGWSAHIVEQRKDNRIVRPSANYIGPAPQPD